MGPLESADLYSTPCVQRVATDKMPSMLKTRVSILSRLPLSRYKSVMRCVASDTAQGCYQRGRQVNRQ